MKFRDWYNGDVKVEQKKTAESLFEEVVGAGVPSLSSFISWLILNKKIKGFIKESKKKRPKSILDENKKRQVEYLVKNLPNVRELAEEFSRKFKKAK